MNKSENEFFFRLSGLIDAHNQFKATLGEADAEYKNIIRLVNDARQTCQDNGLELTPNPYTNIQPEVRSICSKKISSIDFHLGNYSEMERSPNVSSTT